MFGGIYFGALNQKKELSLQFSDKSIFYVTKCHLNLYIFSTVKNTFLNIQKFVNFPYIFGFSQDAEVT